MDHKRTDRLKTLLLLLALAGLAAGMALRVGGRPDLAQTAWFAGVMPVDIAVILNDLRIRPACTDIASQPCQEGAPA